MPSVLYDCIVLSLEEINNRMKYLFGAELDKDKFSYNEILNFLHDVYFDYDAIKEIDNLNKRIKEEI